MRKIYLLFFLPFLFQLSTAQQYSVPYGQLKAFEGVYEYTNQTTLKIAASPRDTLLYAIIDESRYKLTPTGKDLFRDMTSNQVQFFRNGANGIAGYVLNKDTFRLLHTRVSFPKEMWYPRIGSGENFTYAYQQPKQEMDGLETGGLEHTGLDKDLLAQMMQNIVAGVYENVHSVLIIKAGKLVFEEYFFEYNKDSLHQLRSATKSFVSGLVGIALEKGFIKSTKEQVVSYFPEYVLHNGPQAKSSITLEHLLANQSGLDCDVSNEQAAGNEVQMGASNDWVKYTLDLPLIDTPGGKGRYCSGNVIVAGRIIEKATRQPLPRFAQKHLFAPLGITKFKWRFKPDRSSAETFCQLYLRPRDMAKYGLLFLNKGNWKGTQIIPAGWVSQSLSKHSTVQNVDYGYWWWLKYLDADGVRYYGKAAQGNGGQKIYLWPRLNMVTVITGGSYNQQSPSDELISKYILPAFNKSN